MVARRVVDGEGGPIRNDDEDAMSSRAVLTSEPYSEHVSSSKPKGHGHKFCRSNMSDNIPSSKGVASYTISLS